MNKSNTFNVTLDSSANIISFDDPYNLTGHSAADVIGKSWFAVFIPYQNTIEILNIFKDTFQNETVHWQYANTIRHKNGFDIKCAFENKKIFNQNNIQESIYSIGTVL